MRRRRSQIPRRNEPDHSLVQWAVSWHGQDPLACEIHSSGPLDIVVIHGELDIATAPDLGERLGPLAGHGRHLVLDLTGLRFCDAAGLRLFLRLHKQATAAGGSLRLAAPGRPVRRVLSTARLNEVIPVSATAAEAIAALNDVARSEPPALLSGALAAVVVRSAARPAQRRFRTDRIN